MCGHRYIQEESLFLRVSRRGCMLVLLVEEDEEDEDPFGIIIIQELHRLLLLLRIDIISLRHGELEEQ